MFFLSERIGCTFQERLKDGKQRSCEEDERHDLTERPIAGTAVKNRSKLLMFQLKYMQ
jgi:hypothetical protein